MARGRIPNNNPIVMSIRKISHVQECKIYEMGIPISQIAPHINRTYCSSIKVIITDAIQAKLNYYKFVYERNLCKKKKKKKSEWKTKQCTSYFLASSNYDKDYILKSFSKIPVV